MSIPLKAKMRQRALKRDLEGVYILWAFVHRMRTKKITAWNVRPIGSHETRLVRAATTAQAVFVYLYII